MKKISLFILAIALTITSCKNYDDDFKDLNKSIAELQAQVAGFSAVQSSIVALQASMASLTTAVASIPKTQVDISGLTTGVAASNASIAALQAQLTATNVTIAALQAQLAAIVADYATTGDVEATTAAINLLADEITLIQGDIAEILAANNIYDDNLSIANTAELEFALGLGNKVAVINGKLTINTTSLTAAEVVSLATVTSKIYSIVGDGINGALDVTATKAVDLSNLTSAGKSVAITSSLAAVVNLSALTTVNGAYSVSGVNAMDDALKTVIGAVTLNYDGGYEQPNLESAASVTLTNFPTSATALITAGTLVVNFRNLVTANLNTGTANTAVFTVATSVILNEGVTSLTANAANEVQVWAANNLTGLTISATKLLSVITIAGRVDDGATTPAGVALSVTGSATSVLNAAALPRVSTLTVNDIETALSFPALTKATVVTAPATVSFTAPLLVASTSVTLAAAEIVSLASTPSLVAGVTETLTFTALASPYTAASTLKAATVTGKVGAAGAFTSTSAVLASATFAGELDAVSVTGGTLLTSLTTTGAIDSFTLGTSPIITSVSLGHSHIVGGAGSVLVINGNAKLASLTTSTNFLRTLTVTGNALLTTMNFASYVAVPTVAVPTTGFYAVSISGNKLSGTFAPAVAATGTTPYVEAVITSTSLTTLKPWINAYKTANTSGSVLTETSLTMSVDIDDVDATSATVLLSTVMNANAGISDVIDTTTGINTVGEYLLIQ
jgi:hypothetical protein